MLDLNREAKEGVPFSYTDYSMLKFIDGQRAVAPPAAHVRSWYRRYARELCCPFFRPDARLSLLNAPGP